MSFNHNYNTGRQITPVVRDLLIINVLFFVGTQFSEQVSSALALYYPSSQHFRPYQLATHFFMHADLPHIAFNMLGLYGIGIMLELTWGGRRFLAYYFMCAFGSVALHWAMMYWENYQFETALAACRDAPTVQDISNLYDIVMKGLKINSKMPSFIEGLKPENYNSAVEGLANLMKLRMDIPAVGASGAIYGLLSAMWLLYPDIPFRMMFIPFSIKAKHLIPVLFVADFFLGFSRFGGDNVAHFAHMGGALVGGIVLFFWYKKSITR